MMVLQEVLPDDEQLKLRKRLPSEPGVELHIPASRVIWARSEGRSPARAGTPAITSVITITTDVKRVILCSNISFLTAIQFRD